MINLRRLPNGKLELIVPEILEKAGQGPLVQAIFQRWLRSRKAKPGKYARQRRWQKSEAGRRYERWKDANLPSRVAFWKRAKLYDAEAQASGSRRYRDIVRPRKR